MKLNVTQDVSVSHTEMQNLFMFRTKVKHHGTCPLGD